MPEQETTEITPTRDEWHVLWEWNLSRERRCVQDRDYSKAKLHADRAGEIERHIAPADVWERAWSNER